MVAPKLRFKEFNNDWSLKKLGDLSFKPQYGMNSSATEFDGENKYLRITDINEDDHSFNFSKLTSPADDLDDKYLLKNGDLLFARTGASVGKSYLYNSKDGKVYFAGFLIKFSLQTEVNPYFIFSQTLSKKFQNWVITNSMRSGQPGINAEEYSLLPISFTSLKEQTKIATFLSAVDEKISQLSQKLHLLGQYKQGMMQKLFSQQIRFKADDGSEFGEWEERKLSEISQKAMYGMNAAATEYDGINKYLRITDICEFSNSFKIDNLTSPNAELDDKYKLQLGDLLFARTGASVGKSYLYKKNDGITYFAGFLIKFSLNTNLVIPYFIFLQTLTKGFSQWVVTNSMRSGQPGINAEEYSSYIFKVPCLEEQTKIANFLSAIDQKIDVVSEQLEQAKLWKKGLLQQMFV